MIKIVIVEHERPILNVLKEMLFDISKRLNYAISIPNNEDEFIATNYDNARVLIEKVHPDVVLLDLNLGDRTKTGHNLFIDCIVPIAIPVIIITGENSSGLLSPQYFLFNIPFLEKPVNKEELFDELKKLSLDSYKDTVKRRYDFFTKVEKASGNISERIQLKDNQETLVFLNELIFAESVKGEHSTMQCYLKGFPYPIICNEELGKFQSRIELTSIDFVRVGKFYLLNKKQIMKSDKKTFRIQVSSGQWLQISEAAFRNFVGK